jgi:hypothetical protein
MKPSDNAPGESQAEQQPNDAANNQQSQEPTQPLDQDPAPEDKGEPLSDPNDSDGGTNGGAPVANEASIDDNAANTDETAAAPANKHKFDGALSENHGLLINRASDFLAHLEDVLAVDFAHLNEARLQSVRTFFKKGIGELKALGIIPA